MGVPAFPGTVHANSDQPLVHLFDDIRATLLQLHSTQHCVKA
eukprot:COSAG02_NODE_37156_length_445_cov_1.335260_2_plen_41_part_01